MRLSDLQKFILTECGRTGGRSGRERFVTYYASRRKPSRKDQVDVITGALVRLIDRGFLVGYGVRTPKKWYIREVKLTPTGRTTVRALRGEQQRLPLRATENSRW